MTTETTFAISGMSCGDCAARLEKTLLALAGVEAVNASHVLAQAVVRYDAAVIESARVRKAIGQLGYGVTVVQGELTATAGGAERAQLVLVIAVGVLLGLAGSLWFLVTSPPWLAGVFAGLAALLGGYPITAKAIRGLASLLPATVTVKRGETEPEVAASDLVVGAFCHQGSSLLVILNSMRLLTAVTPAAAPRRTYG